ncbi:uncharacterized protein LOC116758368 [Phocoena sinus]|uniref:uncharacterized protein LOC116758368 n=1 Tax=Phocoena sinus TaxID=42100 RepID=UPI0013C487A6|nr:uncharacterized protein LOC116758368 [Phocoena sinus]
MKKADAGPDLAFGLRREALKRSHEFYCELEKGAPPSRPNCPPHPQLLPLPATGCSLARLVGSRVNGRGQRSPRGPRVEQPRVPGSSGSRAPGRGVLGGRSERSAARPTASLTTGPRRAASVPGRHRGYSPTQQLPATTFWVLRLLPRNVRSLATSSGNQRVEACHQHHEAYGYFLLIQTRWQDNDQYGRGNSAVYYSYLDTMINPYPMRLFWPHLLEERCCSHLAPEKEFQTHQGCQFKGLNVPSDLRDEALRGL